MLILIICVNAYTQRINPHAYDNETMDRISLETGANLTNDTTIDITFYHINVEIALDSAYIQGIVTCGMYSVVDGLTSFKLDLDSAYQVTEVTGLISGYSHVGNILQINLQSAMSAGQYFEVGIQYKGVPLLAGGYKGLRYENHDDDEIIIATLSTPYLAHTWWPCKDGTQDKADSVFTNITIRDTILSGIPVIALSNGILDTIISSDNSSTFVWKHRYPVVPYYVMVAISNYTFFNQEFIGEGYSFPIDYYVFDSHYNEAQDGVALMPEAMMFFTEKFGPYPFRDEKYGMTQLGYYGAIENQTNTITNNMSTSWFFVSVHELAHMWFADMITCNTWHHGWLNEGFATYSEALFSEYKYDNYEEYVEQFEYFQAGKVYMENVSNPFTVFQPIIYRKGAYVLHMLRGVVGDDIFFDILYEYANDNAFMYALATTEQFQNVCEDVSGQDLDYFFQQWIYDEWYPMYFYNYAYEPENNKLYIAVNQMQSVMGYRDIFEMPMQIGVTLNNGNDTILEVYNDEKNANYIFDFYEEVLNVEIDPNSWILNKSTYDPDITVGTNENNKLNVQVYPNPSDGEVQISMNHNMDIANISVYNMAGIRLRNLSVTHTENTVRVSGLKSGTYSLVVSSTEGSQQIKLVVL